MSPRQQFWPRDNNADCRGGNPPWFPPSAEQLRWMAANGYAEKAAAMQATGAGYREFATLMWTLRKRPGCTR